MPRKREKEPKSGIEDIETLKEKLAELKDKAEANLAGWQRAQADFINYKKRAEQEKLDLSKFANSALILNLLPILDDFERAFNAIPPKMGKLSWLDGIRLIERKLWAILQAQLSARQGGRAMTRATRLEDTFIDIDPEAIGVERMAYDDRSGDEGEVAWTTKGGKLLTTTQLITAICTDPTRARIAGRVLGVRPLTSVGNVPCSRS